MLLIEMSSNKCIYHPSRDAEVRCNSCNNFICKDCKKEFTTPNSNEETYIDPKDTSLIICQVCSYDNAIHGNMSPREFVMFSAVFSVFIIVGSTILALAFGIIEKPKDMIFSGSIPPDMILFILGLMFTVIPGLMLLTIVTSFLFEIPKKVRKAKKERESFLAEVGLPKDYQLKLICIKCNSKLDMEAEFCTKCGNTTFE